MREQSKDRRNQRERSPGEIEAFNLGMELFYDRPLKKRRHRREVHEYADHRSIIEEITEEY